MVHAKGLKKQNEISLNFILMGSEGSVEKLMRRAAWSSKNAWRTNNKSSKR